ncbi:MAG: hypothetical protein ABIN94_06865 [Ferruginibacter sp.]
MACIFINAVKQNAFTMEVTRVEKTKIMIDAIGEILISKHSSIAIAESVTSGNLQAVFSLARNAASF